MMVKNREISRMEDIDLVTSTPNLECTEVSMKMAAHVKYKFTKAFSWEKILVFWLKFHWTLLTDTW